MRDTSLVFEYASSPENSPPQSQIYAVAEKDQRSRSYRRPEVVKCIGLSRRGPGQLPHPPLVIYMIATLLLVLVSGLFFFFLPGDLCVESSKSPIFFLWYDLECFESSRPLPFDRCFESSIPFFLLFLGELSLLSVLTLLGRGLGRGGFFEPSSESLDFRRDGFSLSPRPEELTLFLVCSDLDRAFLPFGSSPSLDFLRDFLSSLLEVLSDLERVGFFLRLTSMSFSLDLRLGFTSSSSPDDDFFDLRCFDVPSSSFSSLSCPESLDFRLVSFSFFGLVGLFLSASSILGLDLFFDCGFAFAFTFSCSALGFFAFGFFTGLASGSSVSETPAKEVWLEESSFSEAWWLEKRMSEASLPELWE